MVYLALFVIILLLMTATLYWAIAVVLIQAIRDKDPGEVFSWLLCIAFLGTFDYYILSLVWSLWSSL